MPGPTSPPSTTHGSGPARPRTRRRAAVALLLAAGLGLVGTACSSKRNPDTASPDPSSVPATSRDGGPAFPLPKDPGAAIRAANLPELSEEGTAVDMRAHVTVIVDGKAVTVPADIGVNPQAATRSPVHTHDDSGVVHVAADKVDKNGVFTVGQLFTQWGVKLDKNCLDTYCNDATHQLLGFADGQLVGDPASIPFAPGQEVVIWFGPRGTNPSVPTTYAFPPTS